MAHPNLVVITSHGPEALRLALYKEGKFVEGSLTDYDTTADDRVQIAETIEGFRTDSIQIEDDGDAHAAA